MIKSKHNYNIKTGKYTSTSTLTGEEDIPVFSLKAGFLVGGEISVRKTNPIKKMSTYQWNKFLTGMKSYQFGNKSK